MEQYDYIIVGAGLAGASLGYQLQLNNYKVLILEKQSLEKKFKLCGGIITPKTYSLLTMLYPEDEIKSLIVSSFSDSNFSFNNDSVSIEHVTLSVVERPILDKYVINKYLSIQGKILDQIKINNIDFNNNIIYTNKGKFIYKYLIGADGVLSQVRKQYTGKIQNKIFGLEAIVQNHSNISNTTVELLPNHPGYNLIMPFGDKILYGATHYYNPKNVMPIFQQLIQNSSIKQDDIKGAFTPSGNDIFFGENNVYFIGDAAGLIHPVTGEGMYYALLSSYTLFESILHNTNYAEEMNLHCNAIIKKVKHIHKILSNINSFGERILNNSPEQNTLSYNSILL